jgi:hypothetical protein
VTLGLFVMLATLMTQTVSVRVWPANFQFEPGYLRVTVTVEKDERNRWLDVVVDSGEYYSSSGVQLDGLSAARTQPPMEYRDVPAGHYVVTAAVYDGRGESLGTARAETTVLSRHAHQ